MTAPAAHRTRIVATGLTSGLKGIDATATAMTATNGARRLPLPGAANGPNFSRAR